MATGRPITQKKRLTNPSQMHENSSALEGWSALSLFKTLLWSIRFALLGLRLAEQKSRPWRTHFQRVTQTLLSQAKAVRLPVLPEVRWLPRLVWPKFSLPKLRWPAFARPTQTRRRGRPKKSRSFLYSLTSWWATKFVKKPGRKPTSLLSRWRRHWPVLTSLSVRLPRLSLPVPTLIRRFPWRLSMGITGLLLILGAGLYIYDFVFKDLPSPRQLTERPMLVTTKIYDRSGNVLYRIYEDENRSIVRLHELPKHLVEATIAIEDQDFYQHYGFSVRGITRAAWANSQGDVIQGGSTITQQLVKNRLLNSEKTLQRKLKELVLSIAVEQMYEKEEILELYFNQVAYGGSTYGIEEAAQRYFGKSAPELTLGESALLAGLPQAPSLYSPFGPTPELAMSRQQEVLRRMVEEKYITAEQAELASKEPLIYRSDSVDIKAPHFVMYVRQLLAAKYGDEMVNQGGLEVTTTLDLPLQDQTQKTVTDEITRLKRLRITNGAALVTNPKTGEILAMVGSTDYFDFEHDGQVNVTDRPRQPGSSIKPLTYALALERGKTPSSVILDSPVTYYVPGSPPYSPKNYDGRYHGNVPIKEALGSSYNIPAVKLAAEIGVNTLIERGEQMGIDTWKDRSRFGLSLTLGGGEVRMTDMAELYSTFANEGYTTDLNPILEIKNYKGEVLYRNTCVLDNKNCPRRKTLDGRIAFQISQILADNRNRTPAFGPRSVLVIPNQEVAVKTGTTNSLKDNWTIGYTSDRLAAVWVGNNDATPMSYVASGVTGASPIWNNIMRSLLDDSNPHHFAPPEGLITVKICAATGTLPCGGCPRVVEEVFVPGTEPTKACNPEYFRKKDPQPGATPAPPGGVPATNQTTRRDQILTGASVGQ